jgi:hypothetical protein
VLQHCMLWRLALLFELQDGLMCCASLHSCTKYMFLLIMTADHMIMHDMTTSVCRLARRQAASAHHTTASRPGRLLLHTVSRRVLSRPGFELQAGSVLSQLR